MKVRDSGSPISRSAYSSQNAPILASESFATYFTSNAATATPLSKNGSGGTGTSGPVAITTGTFPRPVLARGRVMFAGNDAVLPPTETVIVRFAVVLPDSKG